MKPRCPTESQEMRVLAHWLDLHVGPMGWCHVRNEGRHRAHGVKAGVPDVLIFAMPNGITWGSTIKRGFAIELKRRVGGKVSERQVEWIKALTGHGWGAAICAGADSAIAILKEAGYGK